MMHDRRILVVVPARGGSKGVPLKNIQPLAGRPLLAYTGDLVRQAEWVDQAVVSTDHEAIATVARQSGLDVPFYRPPELSGDRIGDTDVLLHALLESERAYAMTFDVVVMLQPTSPLRSHADVKATVAHLIEGGWDAVWTVSRMPLKYHAFKQLTLDRDGRMTLLDDRGRTIVARQELPPTYYRNGVAYALTRRALVELRTTLPDRSSAIVLEGTFVSIDTIEDFAEVETAMKQRA